MRRDANRSSQCRCAESISRAVANLTLRSHWIARLGRVSEGANEVARHLREAAAGLRVHPRNTPDGGPLATGSRVEPAG